jgi:predicted GNAT family N-acyltransferase
MGHRTGAVDVEVRSGGGKRSGVKSTTPYPRSGMVIEPNIAIAPLDAVRRLRDAILRPDFPPGGSVYPGDAAQETLHAGAFLEGELIAVASICRESPPGEADPLAWRVRGMATVSAWRGRGLASRLLTRCVEHAQSHGGARLWCTARATVSGFYVTHGFVTVGEAFTLAEFSNEVYVRMECIADAFIDRTSRT